MIVFTNQVKSSKYFNYFKLNLLFVLGILQGVYWGLGTGTGAIVGGILINHYGVRVSFRVGGVVSSIIFVLFCILQFVIARKEKSIDSKK